ncbi:hypothetical protein PVL29_020027 [Vitis rotundifolia]|uniref:Cyclin-like domain-containing protein n=1 Tax=Vitis rotundifolia TaxID=103349 RepID=A0AA38Z1Z9_VITRO|nr:hypothetical protein PVL29_020024 [Vitis rotundifolia]KAJ9680896.1 hypothetical protein PVL29_020027 [Vitis rotundifolia]
MVLPEGVRARQDAVNGMLKVHSYHNFRPETAYLSVTHLDRFLCTYDLSGKEWSLQLLSVPCIALAVKMEGRSAPLPLDLQVMEPRFLFTAMTGQQMELLVMAVFKCFTVPAMFRISFSPPAE